MRRFRTPLLLTIALLSFSPSSNAEWKMKTAPLMTRWAADVKPENVLPEYPRPQLVRKDWMNLNGVWEFQPGAASDATPTGKKLTGEILVPFPIESALSGVMEHHDRLWYRRGFTLPSGWDSKRILLHFGAVDHESEIFINGKSLLTHKGGYDPFTVDVTDALKPTGEQELIVRVFDPTNMGGQPRGKQSLYSGGMYTPCTGIWQTVWIEPVAKGGIESLKFIPDIEDGAIKLNVNTMRDTAADAKATVTIKDGDHVLVTTDMTVNEPGATSIKIPNAKLWSPDSPHLYDVQVRLASGGKTIDEVTSYFGMRKIEVGDSDAAKKLLLNGKFVFQIGPLDQGFWPDGVYTAPTDEALKYDLQMIKAMGFNMVRKHIKVEPARWYYWADKLGLLVWQDMPSCNTYPGRDEQTPPVDEAQFKLELTRMIEALQNVPSIVVWVVFNEGQGQHKTVEYVNLVKQLDGTRLVNQASGGGYENAGDLFDIHAYPPPRAPERHPGQALAIGEYGGIGFDIPGHIWRKANTYTQVYSAQELIDLYGEFTQMIKTFRDKNKLSAAIYTQITDVESELNGLLTYDRIPKMDMAEIAKANRFELLPPTFTIVVPASQSERQMWRYTFEKPTDDWMTVDFDDARWFEGKGGFGAPGTPAIGELGTPWTTNDIWLRRTFNLGKLTKDQISKLLVRCYHDEGAVVYINGVKAFEANGFNGNYQNWPMSDAARNALKPDAENVMAVHCTQSDGGQYIDVGLTLRDEPRK
jgi:beta-galactosidase/beta-glucuronidase